MLPRLAGACGVTPQAVSRTEATREGCAKEPAALKLSEVGDAASLVCERSSDPLLLPLQKLIRGLQGGRFGDLVLSG